MSLFGQIKSILKNGDLRPVPKGHSADRRRKGRFSHKGRKILVIDDSATIVASLAKILRSAGCVVREAPDAETGLEIARAEQPDLIFLDIVLPGMNGFAALRQIRRDPLTRHIPVIVISGNEQATEQFYVKRIGAEDFMKKPFSRSEVFSRVETLVIAGRLVKLSTVAEPRYRKSEAAIPANAPPAPADKDGRHAQAAISRGKEAAAENPPDMAMPSAAMTAIEARRQLTAMGLQYFNQEQFAAAIARGDKLAVELFVMGRGIKVRERPPDREKRSP
jgi:twitching motility two-component system response regulator PilH